MPTYFTTHLQTEVNMKFGKKELIISVLVAALGAAVYLNWQLTPKSSGIYPSDEDLGTAHYVNAAIATKDTAPKEPAVVSEPSEEEEYFSRVRLERQKTQDELISLARSVAQSETTSGEAKAQAVAQLNSLMNIVNQQSNIEGLVISKGFDDCVAYIQNGECSVVVSGKELKSDSLTAIKDIVTSQTGISFDKIRVTHL